MVVLLISWTIGWKAQAKEVTDDYFIPETVFLTWQQDPLTTMTIDWHTLKAENRPSILEYRESGTSEWRRAVGSSHDFPFSEREIHRVEVTGLQPGTRYRFRFGDNSKVYTFYTMPANATEPIRFIAGGDNWFDNTGWLKGPVETWYGRIRIRNDEIQRIYLQNNNLSGTLPDEMADLAGLERLHMENNQIEGAFPGWITELSKLERLGLSNNNLTGSLPADMGLHLGNLERLELANNQLTGKIPASLGVPVMLERIDLSGNELEGEIPAALGNLNHRLQRLDLSGNNLSGTIPEALAGALFVRRLDLSREPVYPNHLFILLLCTE